MDTTRPASSGTVAIYRNPDRFTGASLRHAAATTGAAITPPRSVLKKVERFILDMATGVVYGGNNKMSDILLSVLIPSIPERLHLLTGLLNVLHAQDHPQLEVIVMLDNKRRSLGHKRNAMQDMAHGKFICHLDDDDMVPEDFARTLLPACEADVDVVGFDATCSLNGSPEFRVITGIDFPNEQPCHLPGDRYTDIRRKFWQWNAWRKERFSGCRHPEFHHGAEDAVWLNQCYPLIRTHKKLDWIGYIHRYNAKTTTFA